MISIILSAFFLGSSNRMENDDKDYHYIDDDIMLSEFLKSVREQR